MNEAGKKALEWLREKEEVEIIGTYETEEAFDKIRENRPDLVVSSGFEHIVPGDVIDVPEKGVVNLHPSYLPYNRGAHPFIWPIIDGTPAGVSVHFMNEKLDQGPIIARKEVDIRPEDNAKSLRDRLMVEQFELFKNSWKDILQGDTWEQRPEIGNTHYRSELDELSNLDLEEEMSLGEALDLIRGLTYEKGLATFEKDGKRYSIKVQVEEDSN